jgi:hypothetical protein
MCSAFRKQIGVLEMLLSFCLGELKFLLEKRNPPDFSGEPKPVVCNFFQHKKTTCLWQTSGSLFFV